MNDLSNDELLDRLLDRLNYALHHLPTDDELESVEHSTVDHEDLNFFKSGICYATGVVVLSMRTPTQNEKLAVSVRQVINTGFLALEARLAFYQDSPHPPTT